MKSVKNKQSVGGERAASTSRKTRYEEISMLSIALIGAIVLLIDTFKTIAVSSEEGWNEVRLINRNVTVQSLEDENKYRMHIVYDVEEKQKDSIIYWDIDKTSPKKYVEEYEIDLSSQTGGQEING